MDNPYKGLSKQGLLFEIESAARIPPDALIAEGCRRIDELEPDLCQLLDAPIADVGTGGHILAGLLLIEAQSLVAIPHFASIYRHPDKEPLLSPWFDMQLPRFGPPLITPFRSLLRDERTSMSARESTVDILGTIAINHPRSRGEIAHSIREVVSDIGNESAPDENAIRLLLRAISTLVDLRDSETRALADGLADRLDYSIDVRRSLIHFAYLLGEGELPGPERKSMHSILEMYHEVRAWDAMTEADVARRYEESMLDQGVSGDVVSRVMTIYRTRFASKPPSERGEVMVDVIKSTLSSAGVPEPELDLAVKNLLAAVFAHGGAETETELTITSGSPLRIKLRGQDW